MWVRNCTSDPPLIPLYNIPYAVKQHSLCYFKLQMGDKEESVPLKPCNSMAANPTAIPLAHGSPRFNHWLLYQHREHTSGAAHVTPFDPFKLTLLLRPATVDSGTIFPGTPARFFACPTEVPSTSRCPLCNRRQPPLRGGYIFLVASHDQEAGRPL
jgi:hypothetical protein